ncbi:hypothetical protein BGX28_009197 [Mortierella sp. GBA30]|nr:hypothetical protein BGX28_009197 [Mortierella sp. GBA30]
MQHHIHLSPHEGYDIDCPDEFFQCYGSYVLRLLQMLKYGVAVAGLAVLAMTPRRNSVYSIDSRSTSSHNTLEQRINQAIAHLEEWSADQRSRRRWRNNNEGENMLDSQDQGEALERADLTRLSSFLRERDEVLGNLYRIITNEGYVKWVCSEHYHEICNVSAAQEIGDLATIHGGSFDEHLGRIEISLPSAAAATQLYKVMDRAKATQELKLTLQWEANITDVKSLRDAVHRSNVVSVDLKFMASKSTGSILNRHKRADPLWQMIMGAKVQSFTLSGYSGFFRRSAIELQTTDLRVLKLSEAVDWKKDGSKVIDLIRKSPRLCELVLSCTDVNESYESIRRAAAGSCQLNSLSITAGKEDSLRVTFDQDRSHAVRTMQVVVPKLVPEENSLLRASSCITSLHICARSAVYRECSVILELLSRNPRLSELKVGCYVAEFSSVFEHLRKHLASDPSSQLRQVSLYRDDNRLVSTDLSDPTASSLSLELMSLNVNERVLTKLLRAYGASLTKLTIDSPHWKPIHSCALEEATRLHPKVHLQRLTHLYQRCADVDDAILDKLNIVINRSRQSLVEYELVIDKLFKTDPQSSRRWVGFIRVVGERLTKFVMSCSDPSEWIHALGDVDFPAMERISFKHESKVELVNAKRVFSAIVGIGYVARNSNDDGDQDDRTHGRDRLLTHDAIIGVGGW